MSQLNIHTSKDFDNILAEYMRLKHLNTKSEAIRMAIKEGLDAAKKLDYQMSKERKPLQTAEPQPLNYKRSDELAYIRERSVYHDLDQYAGTWSEADEKEFLQATTDFEKIDKEIWK